ncbi:hypothetical protein A5802_003007 [Enterococcus mundtii]|uniref:Uncharacterized protein n=1 Tax=Enterococcus mundtii TaxID=53346 RepID=A0A242KW34_ENTMU|nr:hypothetical protein A5802_003007 [Enterococcus mundtii]
MLGDFSYYLGIIFNPIILLLKDNIFIGVVLLLYVELICYVPLFN